MAIYGTGNHDTIDGADGVTDKKDVIFGLDGDDTIRGLGGDDVMKGGGGADTFYGGNGYDEVNYGDSTEGVTVNLLTGSSHGGTAGDKAYYSIENVTGSLHGDDITGDKADNTLRGLDGIDHLYGLGGTDILEGGGGDDELVGGPGADQLLGGEGFDTAYYRDSPEGVTLSLKHSLALHGTAEGDTFSSIENLTGSNYDDHLYGDDNANEIHGTEGNDVLKGVGGADFLHGGTQDDTIIGGLGSDAMYGGGGADKFVWASADETGLAEADADVIYDFSFADGDRIHLSGIDADVYAAGNQAFTFIGQAAFSGTPGEINYYHDGGNTYIQLQTGMSADVEGVIRIDGIVTPQASWFVL